jgi:hypothetical protein
VETLRLILLFLHVLGFAALIGGLLAQAGTGEKRVNSAMRDGAGTAFLTGLALVGILSAGDQEPNNTKIAVKLVVALVVLVLVMANLRKPSIPQGLWAGILALSVLNVALAVFWSPAHAWV